MNWLFPLQECSGIPVRPHIGSYGFIRKGWAHTGVDLYTNNSEPVYAVEDGIVVGVEHFTGEQINSNWWNNTDCAMVEGESGVICYGEIAVDVMLSQSIKRGQIIGRVSRVIREGKERYDINGWSHSMLHFELYEHGITSPYENIGDGMLDPTEYLIKADGAPNIL